MGSFNCGTIRLIYNCILGINDSVSTQISGAQRSSNNKRRKLSQNDNYQRVSGLIPFRVQTLASFAIA